MDRIYKSILKEDQSLLEFICSPNWKVASVRLSSSIEGSNLAENPTQ